MTQKVSKNVSNIEISPILKFYHPVGKIKPKENKLVDKNKMLIHNPKYENKVEKITKAEKSIIHRL